MITYEEFENDVDFYMKEAKVWKTFVYPTDTVYGIGGICTQEVMQNICNIKKRTINKHFSVIAPDISWIKDNFIVWDHFENTLKKLLNKYNWITMLAIKKQDNFLPWISTNNKIGLRILKHPFQDFIYKLWVPFLTTSANISWSDSQWNIKTISDTILSKVDYSIDWWQLLGKPSTIIDLENNSIVRN